MRHIILILWIWILSGLPALTAAQPAATPTLAGNRYLFVVDVSAAAKKLALPNRQAVFDLIYTGLYGQMRPGDTYGLWTFNEKPHTGIYPMQVWDPDHPLDLASHAAKFLRRQSHQGRARIEPLIQKVFTVIAAVGDVTVFIISDGKTPVTGTPFDQELKGAYAQNAREQRKVRQPFITTLIAQRGEIISASVQIAGNPILLIRPVDPDSSGNAVAEKAVSEPRVQPTGETPLPPAQTHPPKPTTTSEKRLAGRSVAKESQRNPSPVKVAESRQTNATALGKGSHLVSNHTPSGTPGSRRGSDGHEAADHSPGRLNSGGARSSLRSTPPKRIRPEGRSRRKSIIITSKTLAPDSVSAQAVSGSQINISSAKAPDSSKSLAPIKSSPVNHDVRHPEAEANTKLKVRTQADTARGKAPPQDLSKTFEPLQLAARELPASARSIVTNRARPVALATTSVPSPWAWSAAVLLAVGCSLLSLLGLLVWLSLRRFKSNRGQSSFITEYLNRTR